jgi:Mn-containing catalase
LSKSKWIARPIKDIGEEKHRKAASAWAATAAAAHGVSLSQSYICVSGNIVNQALS